MFDPAYNPHAVEDAVFAVPVVVPPAMEPIVRRTDWFAAKMVTAGFVEFWDSVMKLPAHRLSAEDDAVLIVPVVVPPAAEVIENNTDWLGP